MITVLDGPNDIMKASAHARNMQKAREVLANRGVGVLHKHTATVDIRTITFCVKRNGSWQITDCKSGEVLGEADLTDKEYIFYIKLKKFLET